VRAFGDVFDACYAHDHALYYGHENVPDVYHLILHHTYDVNHQTYHHQNQKSHHRRHHYHHRQINHQN
jgi:hypothetical protein